ncbi:MAG: pentapeptide repeat-containing protein [Planctomycetota bacterium]
MIILNPKGEFEKTQPLDPALLKFYEREREWLYLELRQRWLKDEGKAFLEAIIFGLQDPKNLWDKGRLEEEQPGLDFASVTIADGKRFADFKYVHQTKDRNYRDLRRADLKNQNLHYRVNLKRADLTDANLQGTNLSDVNLQEADLSNANLRGADLSDANFQDAVLRNTNFQEANLWNANLQRADLSIANLQMADIGSSNLQKAYFEKAKLQGADFNCADVAGPVLKKSRLDASQSEVEQEIDDRSADFRNVEFSREWRGPRWIIPVIAWIIHLGKKKLAWRKWKGKKKTRREIRMQEYPEPKRWYAGRPTTFFRVATSNVDWSKNPGLKRYIEDEQFIEDFKEKHPKIYWLWAMSSDCGRCLSLWAFWSVFFAGLFAIIYTALPSIVTVDSNLPYGHFFTNLYFSVVTFTTLGFGDIHADNLWGAFVVGAEVVLGYFFLGGLVAILASKLARRA